MIAKSKRCVVFDPEEEYADEGFKPFYDVPPLAKYITENINSFKVCLVPSRGKNIEMLHNLSLFLLDMQERIKGVAYLDFVVEEMNMSYPTAMKSEYYGFMDVCSRGRKRAINLFGVAQRPSEVNTNFRGNLQHQYVFNLSDHVDRSVFARTFGPEYAAKIAQLDVHEYYYRGRRGEIRLGRNLLNSKR